MSRWVCPQAPWIQCVSDGCKYLAAPGEEIITVDFAGDFKPEPGDIVMAPHVIDRKHWRKLTRDGIALYETENLLCQTNPWRGMSAELRAFTHAPWFNYSEANSAVYGDTPRPLTPRRMHAHDLGPVRDIDVLFLGSMNPRRQTILQALQLMGVKVHHIGVHNPVFMPELADVLRRTKVLLNVHFYMPGIFESFRCIPALSHGCVVVSEVSEGNEGAELCVTCNYEGLFNGVKDCLEEW